MNTEIIKFVKENENLIYSIINKFSNACELEDLYQEAIKGIIRAYKNYKTDSNVKFTTYVYKYIFGEVYKYVYQKDRCIKLNKYNLTLLKKINEAKLLLSQKLMKEPTNKELSMFLEIDEAIINNLINYNNIDSLDYVVSDDGKELYLNDLIPSKEFVDIDNIYLRDEINKLQEPDRTIIKMHYFLDKTQSEIATYLGINQVQVSRIETKVLKKMRNNMSSLVKM